MILCINTLTLGLAAFCMELSEAELIRQDQPSDSSGKQIARASVIIIVVRAKISPFECKFSPSKGPITLYYSLIQVCEHIRQAIVGSYDASVNIT